MFKAMLATELVFISSLAGMIGQVGPIIDPGLGSLIGNMGITAVLVWHFWYHTTHSYPKMQDKFSDELRAQREAYLSEQKQSRDRFAEESEKQRTAHREEQLLQRTMHREEMNELRGMLMEVVKSMRVAVHDVKDTAQVVMNKVSLAQDTEKKQQRGSQSQ